MSTSHREAGGGIPSIGALFSETLTDVMNNIVGYLMMGLALMAVAIPVGIFASIVSLIVLYGVMGVGVFASLAGGAAMQEATGDEDLGGMVGALGSMGSIAVAFLLFFAFLLFLAAAMAPLSASLYRAIAAHQRGEGTLTFGAAFSTITQDIGATMGTVLLVTICTLVGVMFCYVGAIVPAALFTFALPMVALHRKGALESMRLCAGHAMAHPSEHGLFILAYFGTSLVAGYIPLFGHVFVLALAVRAYRKMFGDGPEPAL